MQRRMLMMMAVMLIATTDTSDDDYDDGSEDDCNRKCCGCYRLVYAGASLRQVLVFTYFLNVCFDLSSCRISSRLRLLLHKCQQNSERCYTLALYIHSIDLPIASWWSPGLHWWKLDSSACSTNYSISNYNLLASLVGSLR